METMADRLKWLRKEKCHKTQTEVGKHVGVGKAAIQKYENGIVTNIPSDKIELLAEALETTPGFIMGWEPDPEYSRLDERFGLELKKERLKRGKSIKQFSAEIGISERALAKYERGEVIPTFNTALPIAIQLGISIDEYDPRYGKQKLGEPNAIDAEIIRLFSGLSLDGKKKAIDYIHLLLMSEEKQQSSPSDPPSVSPTVP